MRRLFWRVYLHGLLLLVAVSVALLVLGFLWGHDAPGRRAPARLAALLEADLRAPGGEAALQRRLEELHELLGADLELLAPDGRPRARAGRPHEPLPAARRAELLAGDEPGPRHAPGRAFALALGPPGAREGLLLLRWPMSHGLVRLLVVVGLVLGLLALVSAPVARAITRPLERLQATARALAAGDLAARSGLRRRDEVGELARTMDEMAGRLSDRLQAERELLAAVGHELRTPLARLRVALELTEEGPEGEARARLAGMAADLAELEALVENALLAVRLERGAGDAPGGLPLAREAVDPRALLDQAAGRFRRHHPGRALEVALAGGAEALSADPAHLRRVLDNLLDNAARHTPADAPVELWAGPEEDALVVEVRDRGPGVSPEDLPRLFEPFFRADPSRSRARGGVGMGLALCRRLVEAHGGSIRALAREGGGLLVRVRLPARPGGGDGPRLRA